MTIIVNIYILCTVVCFGAFSYCNFLFCSLLRKILSYLVHNHKEIGSRYIRYVLLLNSLQENNLLPKLLFFVKSKVHMCKEEIHFAMKQTVVGITIYDNKSVPNLILINHL